MHHRTYLLPLLTPIPLVYHFTNIAIHANDTQKWQRATPLLLLADTAQEQGAADRSCQANLPQPCVDPARSCGRGDALRHAALHYVQRLPRAQAARLAMQRRVSQSMHQCMQCEHCISPARVQIRHAGQETAAKSIALAKAPGMQLSCRARLLRDAELLIGRHDQHLRAAADRSGNPKTTPGCTRPRAALSCCQPAASCGQVGVRGRRPCRVALARVLLIRASAGRSGRLTPAAPSLQAPTHPALAHRPAPARAQP